MAKYNQSEILPPLTGSSMDANENHQKPTANYRHITLRQ